MQSKTPDFCCDPQIALTGCARRRHVVVTPQRSMSRRSVALRASRAGARRDVGLRARSSPMAILRIGDKHGRRAAEVPSNATITSGAIDPTR